MISASRRTLPARRRGEAHAASLDPRLRGRTGGTPVRAVPAARARLRRACCCSASRTPPSARSPSASARRRSIRRASTSSTPSRANGGPRRRAAHRGHGVRRAVRHHPVARPQAGDDAALRARPRRRRSRRAEPLQFLEPTFVSPAGASGGMRADGRPLTYAQRARAHRARHDRRRVAHHASLSRRSTPCLPPSPAIIDRPTT